MSHPQDEVYHHSLRDPESFWNHQADALHWHKKPSAVLGRTKKTLKSGTEHDHWEWFPGGEISTCYNCIDRHVLAGHGDAPAILYDSPVTATKQRITYSQLLDEVETFAGVLRQEGVKKGDVVLVYSNDAPVISSSRFPLLTRLPRSAYGAGCPGRDTGHFATRCYPCCRVWGLCSRRTGAAHRGLAARGHPHGVVRHRRLQAADPVPLLH